jgi:hypothetical protein
MVLTHNVYNISLRIGHVLQYSLPIDVKFPGFHASKFFLLDLKPFFSRFF